MSRTYFGTDGIRGTVGTAPITPDFMLRLGHAVGRVLKAGERRPTVLIGKDTRISGYMIESALEAGFASAGVDVLLTGPLPTPGVAYLTRALRLSLGVVISASHNAYPDNGIKFFSARGEKLPDDWEHAGRGGARDRAALGRFGRARQGAPARRRQRPLHRVLQEHLQPRAVAQGPEDRRRCRPRRGLSRRARTSSTNSAPRSRRSAARPTASTSTPASAPPRRRRWSTAVPRQRRRLRHRPRRRRRPAADGRCVRPPLQRRRAALRDGRRPAGRRAARCPAWSAR